MPNTPPTDSSTPQYRIELAIAGSFLGRNPTGQEVLIVPVRDGALPLDRSTGDLLLSFRAKGTFALDAGSFESGAAVIECLNAALADTFRVLATDIADRMQAATCIPAAQQVSQALAEWEQLLRGRRELSREQEIGLWGELWLLQQLHPIDQGVASWRGPDAEHVDFVGGGIGIEVKTSRRRLEHFVSQEQVTRPLGDLEVFIISLWVDHDPAGGVTLGEMVSICESKISLSRDFEEKLLKSGYSRADSSRYQQRLRRLEPPLAFPVGVVPRVRDADAGVTQIRFLVALDERTALSHSDSLALLGKLCAPTSHPSSPT